MADYNYLSSYTYNGVKYNRGDAVVVNGDYYYSADNTSRNGNTNGNITKYFYGYIRYNNGGTFRHPLALMNGSDHTWPSFAYMDFSSIRSGGTALRYTITVDLNGADNANGLGNMQPKIGARDYYAFSDNVPIKTGHTFKGLYTARTGGEQVYNSNGIAVNSTYWSVSNGTYKWKYAGNVTLYAQYTTNNYAFNLNILHPDGTEKPTLTGTAGTVEISVNGGAYTRVYNEPQRSYPFGTTFSFRNFATNTYMRLTSVTGATQNADGTWSATMGTGGIIVAFSTAYNSYTLSVDPNGGTWNGLETVQSFTQEYGTVKTITDPTKEGYVFNGWSLTGHGTIVNGTYTYREGDGELLALWKPKTYTVTFDSESVGGSANTTKQITHGSTISELPIPTKRFYKFVGWFDSDGVQVTSDRIITADTTFYARFVIDASATIITENGIKPVVAWVSKDGQAWKKCYIWVTKDGLWKQSVGSGL